MRTVPPATPKNFLLAALPAASLARLQRHMTVEETQLRDLSFRAHTTTDVMFPSDAVVSLLREFEDGSMVEIGMVGREGLVGINAVLGVPDNFHTGITQGRGMLVRMPAEALREEARRTTAVMDILLRYVYAFTASATQLAACNRLHVVTKRLAHWLLLLHDRVGSDEMSLTQEFLALMLGTRRAGINAAIAELTKAGAIRHARQRVTVIDRHRLEAESCPCYAVTVEEYERSLGFPPAARTRRSKID